MGRYDDVFKDPQTPEFNPVPWLVVVIAVMVLGFTSYLIQNC